MLFVRNLDGLWVLLVLGAGVAAASWWLPEEALVWVAHLVVWLLLLLLAAPRSVLELARRGLRSGGSDAHQLAALTPVPAVLWVGAFFVAARPHSLVASSGSGAGAPVPYDANLPGPDGKPVARCGLVRQFGGMIGSCGWRR